MEIVRKVRGPVVKHWFSSILITLNGISLIERTVTWFGFLISMANLWQEEEMWEGLETRGQVKFIYTYVYNRSTSLTVLHCLGGVGITQRNVRRPHFERALIRLLNFSGSLSGNK
jgi:hypothetical protein